jgi:poly-beta-1,6-N-acetyl-D-glucosamine synthase
MFVQYIFWISVAVILYVYVGYPLLLWSLQFLFRIPVCKKPITPSVSLLIAAYNEAEVIAAKIRNALALDYPPEKLEIVIASDGSTDDTAKIVRSFTAEYRSRVRLLEFPINRGKLSVLNDAIPHLRSGIVVFSDASSMLASDSLLRLAANFADERVGAASGVYRVVNHDGTSMGWAENFYWKYETFIKDQEARIGALTGAHGSFYAIRKSLYPFPPVDLVNDDFVIPSSVLQHGFRIAYETEAASYEEAEEMEGFGRRVRIAAGNVGQLRTMAAMLWPSRPLALFCFLSHKGGRLLVALALIALAASSFLLGGMPFFRWFLWAQIAFYGLAFMGAFVRLQPKLLRLPFYFCMINAALFVWLYQFLLQRGKPAATGGSRRQVEWS